MVGPPNDSNTSKPWLKAHAYVGIHLIEPVTEQLLKHHTSKTAIAPVAPNTYHLPASHSITFMHEVWGDNFRPPYSKPIGKRRHKDGEPYWETHNEIKGVDLSNPDQDVGLVIWSRRNFLGRKPGSTFIFFEDKLYHVLTWTDVLGPKHGKQSAMSFKRSKRLIFYIQERNDEDCRVMVDTFKAENTPYRKGW
jgi:hypothetical protein